MVAQICGSEHVGLQYLTGSASVEVLPTSPGQGGSPTGNELEASKTRTASWGSALCIGCDIPDDVL